jgi:hypothetical protein
MLLQGVATSFPVLIARYVCEMNCHTDLKIIPINSRAMSGAMVGIVGATNSMVAEMTDSTNIAIVISPNFPCVLITDTDSGLCMDSLCVRLGFGGRV